MVLPYLRALHREVLQGSARRHGLVASTALVLSSCIILYDTTLYSCTDDRTPKEEGLGHPHLPGAGPQKAEISLDYTSPPRR